MTGKKQGWGAWTLIVLVVGYMGLLILAPIVALIQGALGEGFQAVWRNLTKPAFGQSLLLSLEIALLVVLVQLVLGTLVAWVLVRHDFLGKNLLNGIINIPFAISPVVVGYMVLLVFGRNGLLFPLLHRLNIPVSSAYALMSPESAKTPVALWVSTPHIGGQGSSLKARARSPNTSTKTSST